MPRLFAIAPVVPVLLASSFSLLVTSTNGALAPTQWLTQSWLAQSPSPSSAKPLILVPSKPFEPDTQLIGTPKGGDRRVMLAAIDHSLRYLQTERAANDYQKLAALGISRDRARRSLERFRQLVLKARTAAELQAAVNREFVLYQATGKDGQGTVGFTGYFEPVHTASPVRTQQFRYPIFCLPANFSTWKKPHPTRAQLEGVDGLQFRQSQLKGNELVWLRDRLEAYLIQVQGSARLRLTNGKTMTVGYAAATDHPYVSMGRELVNAGKIKQEELNLPALIQYFEQNPADLDVYLPRNQRFVFFKATGGAPATGSLGVPVMPERSIATDKSLFPPGALALIQAQIPYATNGKLEQRRVTRFVVDQDTGSAIKGAGRVDIFMGTGQLAGDRAGLINSPGQLYYLLLKK